MDLSVRIGALTLKNPVIAASGCFGYGVEYADIVDLSSLGGIVVKGLFLKEREGHPAPRIVETPAGMLNAIGLQGIGVRRFVEESCRSFGPARDRLVNVCGTTRRVCRGVTDSVRARGRCRHRAEHLVPEHQGRRHQPVAA
jgi:dihydroorotate dehydrogenase (NAD+) catalytic subunit